MLQLISETQELLCYVKGVCDFMLVASVETGSTRMWIIICRILANSPVFVFCFEGVRLKKTNKTV